MDLRLRLPTALLLAACGTLHCASGQEAAPGGSADGNGGGDLPGVGGSLPGTGGFGPGFGGGPAGGDAIGSGGAGGATGTGEGGAAGGGRADAGADGSAQADAGTDGDASGDGTGPSLEGGTKTDGSDPPDTGHAPDAGHLPEAAPDVGVDPDAGPVPDATPDATFAPDAGGVPDATPDATFAPDAGDGAPPNTAPGYINLAPPMGDPLDPEGGTPLDPPPPEGWTWYPIEGTQCRDGSGAGFFVRFTASDKLFIYLEGGGACTNEGFCDYNPENVNRAVSGDGQTVIGSAFGTIDARQQPGVFELGQLNGIFDPANAENPLRDWNGLYVPYCTGDVHFGTRPNGTVPGVAAQQQFVGHLNMQRFIGRIVPTFRDSVDRVLLTGASAGSFGAALNYSMVQDAFGEVRVDALLDSGVPFTDTYMPACLQARWREAWGLDAALPPDCAECFSADGGGLLGLADFLMEKHPNSRIAVVSSMEDEMIRLFFSTGLSDCANYDDAHPVWITLGALDPNVYYPAADYRAGLNEVRTIYAGTGRLATYYLGGLDVTFHQHIWRTRFTAMPFGGGKSIAQFTSEFLDGQVQQIGP